MDKVNNIFDNPKDFIMSYHNAMGLTDDDMEQPDGFSTLFRVVHRQTA